LTDDTTTTDSPGVFGCPVMVMFIFTPVLKPEPVRFVIETVPVLLAVFGVIKVTVTGVGGLGVILNVFGSVPIPPSVFVTTA
jgi:hypothetical protein